jgi:hypothetical protein
VSVLEKHEPTVEPLVLVPLAFGWLNILLGFVLLILGMCFTAAIPLSATLDNWIRQQQASVQKEFKTKHAEEVAALEKQLSEATTDEEKANIKQQIEDAKNAPPPPVIDFGTKNFGLNDPYIFAHFSIDSASGLILNLLLFVSGFALLRAREWGRKLAVGIACVKLVRLLALTASLGLVVEPKMVARFGAWLQESSVQLAASAKEQGEEPLVTPQEAVEITADLRSLLLSLGIYILILGSVYPALSLWLLTRPGTRAACMKRSLPPPAAPPPFDPKGT